MQKEREIERERRKEMQFISFIKYHQLKIKSASKMPKPKRRPRKRKCGKHGIGNVFARLRGAPPTEETQERGREPQ